MLFGGRRRRRRRGGVMCARRRRSPVVRGGLAIFDPLKINTTTLVSRKWSHQRYLVVASPEQSPQSIQLPLNGSVPPPLLGGPAGWFSRLWLVRFKFLFRHLYNSVFGFVQLSTFLSGPLLPPSHLHAFDATYSSSSIVGGIHCGPPLLGHPIIII